MAIGLRVRPSLAPPSPTKFKKHLRVRNTRGRQQQQRRCDFGHERDDRYE